MDALLAPRAAFALLLAAAVAILGAALAFQYLGGLQPCALCLWQRYPYAAVIGLSGVGLGLAGVRGMPRAPLAAAFALIALALAAGAGIAAFHVGVENGWWQGLPACEGATGTARTVEELGRQLRGRPVARCDEVAWSFAGLSMAGYNVLASALLAAFAGLAARRAAR